MKNISNEKLDDYIDKARASVTKADEIVEAVERRIKLYDSKENVEMFKKNVKNCESMLELLLTEKQNRGRV